VEGDYLARLTDAVTLDDWSAVVARAVTDAKKGDGRAREWLSRYLVSSADISTLGDSIQVVQVGIDTDRL